MPNLRKGEAPPSVLRHPLLDDINKKLLRGDSVLSVVNWLKAKGLPVSRPTITKYYSWLQEHKEIAFIENGGAEVMTIKMAEGAAMQEVNEMGALNNAIKQFEDVDWSQVTESEKVRYGLSAIGVKQNILSEREDLKDQHRIDVLEQLMTAVISGELQDVLIGIKDDIRRERLKEESIDAEYTVKE